MRGVERFGSRPALEAAGRTLTYAELGEQAGAIAATLQREDPPDPQLTAVFAYRTPVAFAGVQGALMAARGYVPLDRTYPVDRTRRMLERVGCSSIVCDTASAEQLPEVLAGLEGARLVLAPDHPDPAALAARLPGHRVLGAGDLAPATAWTAPDVEPDALAYVLFTSGSTGTPKGAMVTNANLRHYADRMAERYAPAEDDRFSQVNELAFDISVYELFVAWEGASCLCCPSRRTLIKPGRWIREAQLTQWFSVPSTAVFMRRLGELKPGSYPTLRHSQFGGERFPLDVALAWLEAAPNGVLECVYGPTETTVVCSQHVFDPITSPPLCEGGILPIGDPVPGLGLVVVDDELHEVAAGAVGELIVGGPQVSRGYIGDPERTARSFVVPPGRNAVHYRTGDRVRRPVADGPFVFVGRVDDQIQVFGERIELGEVEDALRRASGIDAVAAIGWPMGPAGPTGVEGFVGSEQIDVDELRAKLRGTLLGHMVPRRIHALAELPRNANGKIDRRELANRLEATS